LKYWEIIADNLSKAGWSWAVSQPQIVRGEPSGMLTRIAVTGRRFIMHADEKLTAFLELNRRFALVANWA
jgi:hypothetical protein